MQFDLDTRRATLSVGEFAAFSLGPRDSGGGAAGLWRAQLGTYWHREMRGRTSAEHGGALFELPISGELAHRGWLFALTGRIDQLLPGAGDPANGGGAPLVFREIKTVQDPLPRDDAELRRDYPSYFLQLSTYVALWRQGASTLAVPGAASAAAPARAELVFVEAASGLAQTIGLTAADDGALRAQLEGVAAFLDLRLRARERLRRLRFRPAFPAPRPGQESTRAELDRALRGQHGPVFFEAPTGFGKTGVLLESALGQLRDGHFERVLYLTGKSTGQWQVARTLAEMTRPEPGQGGPVAVWQVRNKGEHCVNPVFSCVREQCGFLDGAASRWAQSGLARFYLFDDEPRDLESLRAAGRAARICPYEITRAALAFNEVWIGDYNYVFAPRSRGLFYDQPGFEPARTLLVIDEAHNLPARVADAHSHVVRAADAAALLAELDHAGARPALQRAWESWARLLAALAPSDALGPAMEADVADTLARVTRELAEAPPDYAALAAPAAAVLWQAQEISDWLELPLLKKLLWSPRAAELHATCLDAAEAIGETLRAYGGVVFASATLSPVAEFAGNCGLAAPPAAGGPAAPALVSAKTPWRDGAYDVAFDARVDTRFQQRASHYRATAATVEALRRAADRIRAAGEPAGVAVFFPSYAYAEAIGRALEAAGSVLRISLQPRGPDLAAQAAWVEEALALSDALFLVLGSRFAESVDLLGGRVSHAMVVGPALPEVNAVQRARLAEYAPLGREEAARRVYQIPGMTKVNQALGRLVRAPGQRARVVLHCARFLETSYARLLAPEYQLGTNLLDDDALAAWLDRDRVPVPGAPETN